MTAIEIADMPVAEKLKLIGGNRGKLMLFHECRFVRRQPVVKKQAQRPAGIARDLMGQI